jgi:hypothetical protein
MFRDGIFENFGDFLDSVKESTGDFAGPELKEIRYDVWYRDNNDPTLGLIKFGKYGVIANSPSEAKEHVHATLEDEVPGNKFEIMDVKLRNESKLEEDEEPSFTAEEQKVVQQIKKEYANSNKRYDFWIGEREDGTLTWEGGFELQLRKEFRNTYSLLPNGTVVKNIFSNESKLEEDTRKEAEQTMQPQEEQSKEDAERLSMEDWSEEDKDGAPKRKDKVEYDSKLREPEEKEFSQEVKYERKTDPLYLCNECFKTFRSKGFACTFCASPKTERIVKEVAVTQDVADSIISFYKQARGKGKSREEATQIAAKASKGRMDPVSVRRLLDKEGIDTATIPERPEESKIKEDGTDVGYYKFVFSVQYKLDGAAKEDRVEAFNEEDAKRMVLKKQPDAIIIGAKKIGEAKVKEQDENGYMTVAKGIEDKQTADSVARDKGGQVIADDEDPKKFAIVVKKEK